MSATWSSVADPDVVQLPDSGRGLPASCVRRVDGAVVKLRTRASWVMGRRDDQRAPYRGVNPELNGWIGASTAPRADRCQPSRRAHPPHPPFTTNQTPVLARYDVPRPSSVPGYYPSQCYPSTRSILLPINPVAHIGVIAAIMSSCVAQVVVFACKAGGSAVPGGKSHSRQRLLRAMLRSDLGLRQG